MKNELATLFDQDQHEREDHPPYGTPEYLTLRRRDAARRNRVLEIIQEGGLNSSGDYYHAAMIFQHGETLEELKRANDLARRSIEMGCEEAKWLYAASLDRWLMYQGKPQMYGTNIVPDGRRHRLWDVDPSTTDEERAEWGVPPLSEMMRRADEATEKEPMPPMDDAPQWLQDAIERWYPDAKRPTKGSS